MKCSICGAPARMRNAHGAACSLLHGKAIAKARGVSHPAWIGLGGSLPTTPTIGGLFDFLVGDDAASFASAQRSALNADIANQRAALAAQMRAVTGEATTDAAIKLAVAGVAVASFAVLLWKLANRNKERA